MIAHFERFTIEMTKMQAFSASHPGPCDSDVAELLSIPKIRRQINKIDSQAIRDELREYGAWSDTELADDKANAARIVWIAAGNIREEINQHK